MIIGTAGHIDHGKTALVHALTGIDTDRLPEEKRRGISIDLGYAYVDGLRPGERIGFIDVPGHERLVHTMLAGATGIDHALLLVAADDGVMPQTHEHLAVLSLLGIASATLVVNKVDRVSADRVQEVLHALRALVAGTPLAEAPAFAVSATRGDGVDALRRHLLALAPLARASDADSGFRLAVDRVFTLEGIGTVATGTVEAGEVRVGDELLLVPSPAPLHARVRSLHAQNQPAERGGIGQRCALALPGLHRDAVRRGQVLCSPGIALSTQRLDVLLSAWAADATPLRSGAGVHVHLGADDAVAVITPLDDEALAPGRSARAQLVTRTPVAAWRGQRLVLRDLSARRTLAGCTVLDPFAPTRHRRTPQRLQWLSAAALADPAARWAALLESSPAGLDLARQARREGLACAPPLPSWAVRAGTLAFSPAHWQQLRAGVLGALDRFHADTPDELGPSTSRLRRLAAPLLAPAAWPALVAGLVHDGELAQEGAWLHRPQHAVALSAAERALAERVLPLIRAGDIDPPWLRELATTLGQPEPQLRMGLARIARRGEIFPVVRDLYFHARTLERLACLVRELAGREGEVRAASFRDACGLGRKRAIQILEFFDRMGLLRRVKDAHVLRADGDGFMAPAE